MTVAVKKKNLVLGGAVVVVCALLFVLFAAPAGTAGYEDVGGGIIYLEVEGTIPETACIERGLDDKIIVLESENCHACKTAKHRLRGVESQVGVEIEYLDLSKTVNQNKADSYGIRVKYTPTLLVGCGVYIGVKDTEEYTKIVRGFLG